jgi:tetratricopeptide (TPR) repeat protein
MLVLLMVAAVFGPCTAMQVPREIGRWKLTEAIRMREAGDKDAAYDTLEEAVGFFTKSTELWLTKAEWLLADGKREEAIAAADQMLEIAEETVESLQFHSQFLQNAGEFKRAVDDWKKIVRINEVSGKPGTAQAMNGLAYAQAIANVELEEALSNVNTALNSAEEHPAYLDTRAYIYYRLAQAASGDEAQELLAKGLADMDPAVKTMDKFVAASRAAEPLPAPAMRARSARPKAMREMEPSYENTARSSAVMHYHRALILEGLGRKKEAQAERAVAKRLTGREPDETLF